MTIVLQVLPALVNGGVERGTVEMTAALVKAGHTAFVASSGGSMTYDIVNAGGSHFTLPLNSKNPLEMYRNIDRLSELIRRYKIDIVHARSRAPAWSAFAATRRTHTHFVTTFHNAYGARSWPKRLYNSVMARGERVIAISDFVAAHISKTYHVPRRRLRTIHRGVDITQFDPHHIDDMRLQALRNAWNINPDQPLIVLPGRMSSWKGHDILIAAMSRLKHKKAQALFIGGGPSDDETTIERLIHQHELGHRIRSVGICRDMPAALMLADIVVSPATRPEGFGRVITEAQAMGCPVIATNHGGARETILEGETGWLVPPNDARALAESIDHALDLTPKQRAKIGARAIEHIRENFTTSAMTDATLKVYAEVMNQK